MSRPPRADEPVLLVRGHLQVRGTVIRAGYSELTIALGQDLPLRGATAEVVLEYVVEEGICRLHGRARPGTAERQVTVSHRGRVQLLQRAEVVQAFLTRDVTAHRTRDDATVAAATTVLGGACIAVRGVHDAFEGELFDVEVDLADGLRPARGKVRVQRVHAGGFEGRWDHLNSTDRLRVLRAAHEARRT